ncbi:Potassium transporter 26 [Apostasia shenzhenica]|uniref:Potassium transporter n=1 Tax=Apostasia shenzhenica TaxID=1088818 RepID=A0A2I0AS14_9ASPA|nr:Potassium transporter 26 [Apostasia shenzhenica]
MATFLQNEGRFSSSSAAVSSRSSFLSPPALPGKMASVEDGHRGREETSKEKNSQHQISNSLSFVNDYKIPHRKPLDLTLVQTLLLGYQSLGVVYGDIGTSPLYVFSSISLSEPGEKDILGILSLIFWTLTLMGLIKYVFIVLHADDHGEGGTFALYSLLRQHVNFKGKMIVPTTRLASDINLSFYSNGSNLQSKAKRFLENNKMAQGIITFIVLLGTCMVIGDGALTPAISDDVVLLSVAILVVLFLFQRFGTNKVSFSFSPIMVLWFLFTAAIGIYNIIKFYPMVLKALSPHYIFYFFERNHKKGWELLGAVALCITGAEAMFADLGHFSKRGIQLSYSVIVYPALILAYSGEAAFLIKNPEKISTAFYSSVPEPVFWPMFVVATLAAIVASQALISASFSIIRQSVALGCFPRVTMIHTSNKHEGQVYSPEVNYFLMIVCILITVGFKGGVEIGNAFGVAVIWVMLITTFLMAVVMLVIWDTNIIIVLAFLTVFVGIEGVYMSSLLNKLVQGGWVPFAISAFFLIITLAWTYGRSKKSEYEAGKKMNLQELTQLAQSSVRVPGICFFCTDLVNGIPPIIRHYVQYVGTLRDVTVLITVRTLPIRSVLPEERFIVAKLGADGVYRCMVQYGYMDRQSMDGADYARSIVAVLKEIARDGREVEQLDSALTEGAIFVLGRIILNAGEKNGCFKKWAINNLYRFLQKNFRSNVAALRIPPSKVLQVGMLYEI